MSAPRTRAGSLDIDWKARWIEPVEAPDSPPVHRLAQHLRGEIDLDDGFTSAVLHVTAHGIYEAFVNGVRVGDLELTPGFTSYRERLQVQSFDVTELLTSGPNVIGAILSDGWWRGRHGIVRAVDAYGATTALLAQLHVIGPSGEVVHGTDATWRSTPSHILAADLMAGEVHDLRRRVERWAQPGAAGTGWEPVRVADHGFDTLCAVVGPPTRRIEVLPARTVDQLPSGRFVVDFGQHSNGWIELCDLGPAGTVSTITYGEALDADGEVIQDNIGWSPLAMRLPVEVPFQTDVVISVGDGSTFEPRHSTKGFRYVGIEGHPGPLAPDDLRSIVVHTDLRRIGTFACSDDRINRLHEVAVWSFRGNACEIPTDCPTRERAGWTGDWQLYVETAAYLYDVTDWSRRWLFDAAAEQLPDGRISQIAPDPTPDAKWWRDGHGSAGWGDAIVHVPWELYRSTGRTDVLAEQLEAMCRWVDYAAGAAAGGRHRSRVERSVAPAPHERYIWDTGWHFGEWSAPGDPDTDLRERDHGPVATAYLHRSAAELSQIAGILGRHDLADRYGELAAHVADAWRTEFLDDDGHLRAATQANLARAIAFGLVSGGARDQAAADLVQLIRAAGMHLGTGFLATPLLLPVLADTGHLDVAYELLFQDSPPSWLHMIDRGATTIWEAWDAVHDDGSAHGSLNHYSKGAVISFLHRYTAGLQLVSPGYARFRVAPRPGGGITAASTAHEAPAGRIQVEWTGTAEAGTSFVTVPPGAVAELALPDGSSNVLEAGRHERRWGRAPALP